MTLRLKSKVIIIFIVFGLVIFLLTSLIISPFLKKLQFENISREIKTQQVHIDLALTTFIKNMQVNTKILSINELVRIKNHKNFTSFLNADDKTFQYNLSRHEKSIRLFFNQYRISHPYINSVYMGRENGSFVRSHLRAKPTKYDPRSRPWYKLAKNNPDKVMKTRPYRSVTTNDVNIGIVKALVDKNNKVYGVVGIDVTLKNLTSYMSKVKLVRDGYMMLLDKKGIILVGKKQEEKFTHIKNKIKNYQNIFKTKTGYFLFKTVTKNKSFYCFYYCSKKLGWKILSIIPRYDIQGEINTMLSMTLGIFLMLLILVTFASLLGLNKFVLNPLTQISNISNEITETKNFNLRIKTNQQDELGDLANSFNLMTQSIQDYENILKENKKNIELALSNSESVNRFKEELFSILSHEIRTPLTGIIGFSELIMRDENVKVEIKDYAEKIVFSARRLNHLLENLIRLSDFQANEEVENKVEPINLEELVNDILHMLIFQIEKRNCKVSINIECANFINSDYIKLKLILYNLISNAVKFTKDDEVNIGIRKIENYYEFKIEDKGIGIKPENLDLIFEMFKQVESSNSRRFQGLGVGLTVSKKMVNSLGGEIWVQSEYKKGSTFNFTIKAEE